MPQVRFPTPPHLSTSHRACCNQQFLYKLHPARFNNNKTSSFGYFLSKFTLPLCRVIKSRHLEKFAHGISWEAFIVASIVSIGLLYTPIRFTPKQERTSHNLTTFLRQSDKLGLGWSGNCKNIGGSEGESCSWSLFHSARKIAQRLYATSQHESGKSKAVCRDYTA